MLVGSVEEFILIIIIKLLQKDGNFERLFSVQRTAMMEYYLIKSRTSIFFNLMPNSLTFNDLDIYDNGFTSSVL